MLRDGAKGVNMDTLLDASPDSLHPFDRSVQGGEKDDDVKFSTGTAAEKATTTSHPPHVQQQNGIATPVHSSTDPDVSSSESDSESDRHMKKEPSESVSHTVIDSVKCDSQDTDVSGSSHYSESGSEDVIDLARGSASPSPKPSHASLVMERLHTSSDKGSSNYDTNSSTSSSEHNGTDSDTLDGGKQKQTDSGRHTNTSCEAKVQQVFSQLQDSLQGFLYGRQKELQDYLITITSSPRDYGIYVSKVSSALGVTTLCVYVASSLLLWLYAISDTCLIVILTNSILSVSASISLLSFRLFISHSHLPVLI